MAKKKMIKTSTLEYRFNKLHNAANYAEDCCKAIVFHSDRLLQLQPTPEQEERIAEMQQSIEEWCDKFASLASEMQKAESLYFDHLSDDKTKVELFEEIPSPSGAIPDYFKIEGKLLDIGYIDVEGDPYKVEERKFSVQEIISDIQELDLYVVLCIKALAYPDYTGVWESVGKRACEIYEYDAKESIYRFLVSYGVDFSSDDI